MSNFRICNKKEFIITFPRDFVYLTSKEIVFQKLDNFFKLNKFDYIIGQEYNSNGDLHYHIYLKCNKSNGFNTRDSRCFDIPLPKKIVCFYDKDENLVKQMAFEDFNYDERNCEIFCKHEEYAYGTVDFATACLIKSYKLLSDAHPNIVFKGNKNFDWAQGTVNMIEYVTKQDKEPISNFDWKALLDKLKNKGKKRKYEEFLEDEEDFFEWIRNKLNQGFTEGDIWNEITNDNKKFYVACKNMTNTKNVLGTFFKKQKSEKPIPYVGTYWVPVDLYDYLIYLDNWIKLFHEELLAKIDDEHDFDHCFDEFVKKYPERPKSCYIVGPGNCGKTSLISCFKSFSYWCNGWNYSNYENLMAFNLFDDYDGQCGTTTLTNNDFNYLKSWFACQQVISISGKWEKAKSIRNHKPMIFISNYEPSVRFVESNLKYLKQIDCKFINIDKHMKDKPSRWTIGGFAKYREFDFKTTWTYLNLYPIDKESNKENTPPETSISIPASGYNSESDSDNGVQLLKSGWTSEDEFEAELKWRQDGCPTIDDIEDEVPRQGQNISTKALASTSNWTPNNCTQTTSGLDGTTNHIFMMKYYDNIIKDINRQIRCEDKILKNWDSIKFDCKQRIDILKRRYENSFNKKWTKWLELSVKDLENIRFNILNEIRELNDKIIEANRKIDSASDRIENLVEQLISVYKFKQNTYK